MKRKRVKVNTKLDKTVKVYTHSTLFPSGKRGPKSDVTVRSFRDGDKSGWSKAIEGLKGSRIVAIGCESGAMVAHFAYLPLSPW